MANAVPAIARTFRIPFRVTPPPSRVGLTEEQARQAATVQVVTLPVAAIPRAPCVMNDTGVLKAVVRTWNYAAYCSAIVGASILMK